MRWIRHPWMMVENDRDRCAFCGHTGRRMAKHLRTGLCICVQCAPELQLVAKAP